jgi:hypothetical protein
LGEGTRARRGKGRRRWAGRGGARAPARAHGQQAAAQTRGPPEREEGPRLVRPRRYIRRKPIAAGHLSQAWQSRKGRQRHSTCRAGPANVPGAEPVQALSAIQSWRPPSPALRSTAGGLHQRPILRSLLTLTNRLPEATSARTADEAGLVLAGLIRHPNAGRTELMDFEPLAFHFRALSASPTQPCPLRSAPPTSPTFLSPEGRRTASPTRTTPVRPASAALSSCSS